MMGRRPSRLPLLSENIENKALNAIHAAAVTFGETANSQLLQCGQVARP